MVLNKIYQELVLIKKELQAIRNNLEPKNLVVNTFAEASEKLKSAIDSADPY